ncbi:MAG: glycyl-radical enzyme activating protein [Clostridiales Family XIII bacterium]|jgi:pyruvate formate lyase activating enzyme|nr:glycyl-radical enzyme activating protein [Clostridiales Family XIII bacterium]
MTGSDRQGAEGDGAAGAPLGLVSHIQKFSVDDGPGIRTTVFLKGCNLSCLWCHNPECIDRHRELQFVASLCVSCGRCAAACPTGALPAPGRIEREACSLCGACAAACGSKALKISGEHMPAGSVVERLIRDRPFFDESGGGVTVSGGEALLQADFVRGLLMELKGLGVHTAVDTAACVPFSSFEKVLPYTDIFLIDIKLFDDGLHRRYTGASNRQVFENIRRLKGSGCRIHIRTPLINGVNCADSEMEGIAGFVADSGNIDLVELLAYHSYGEGKYPSLDREYLLSGDLKPSAEFLRRAEAVFRAKGIETTVQE